MNDYERQVFELPRVKRVLELIGLVTIAWNSIESLWYLIYTGLQHETPRDKTDQVFKQFNSGSSQRQLISAVAKVTFSDHPELYEEIIKLLKLSNDLAALRNSIIHGVYRFDHLNGEPGLCISPMGSMNRRPNKLSEVGTELVDELSVIFDKIDEHEKELDDFRYIMIQEFLPNRKDNLPMSQEEIDALPKIFRDSLPREKRERVAPQRLRAKD